jgi:membrane-bound lytic murein transglycosylase B
MSHVRQFAFGGALLCAAVFGAIVVFAPSWRSMPEEPPVPPGGPVVMREQKTAEAQAFLDALRADAEAKGVKLDVFERATKGFATDDEIAALNASQPEHVRTTGDYVSLLVSEMRLANGRGKLIEHAELLAKIEQRYGVDRHVVLAIWGVESSYGFSMGERNVIRSLSTLALTDQRRAPFWRSELLAALTIAQRGDIASDAMTGSWAGAMGHTQFMPSTYLAHAVDFDGDGRRDIWTSPADALASAANYLKVSGWVTGQPAIIEVVLPDKFDFAQSAPSVSKSGKEWLGLGLKPVRPVAGLDALGGLQVIVPAGHAGPAFLVGANFRAILKYNRAVPYALAVSHLGERLAGAPAFTQAWPAGDKALSRSEREEMQTRLTALGHDIGAIDGIIGSATRTAIRAFQRAEAMPEDGHPDGQLLMRLRRTANKPAP